MKDQDLIREISKRDRVITNLLTEVVAEKIRRYGAERVSIERALKSLTLEPDKLEGICDNEQDRAFIQAMEISNESDLPPMRKAEILSKDLATILSGDYKKGLIKDIKEAVDKRRIELLKEF